MTASELSSKGFEPAQISQILKINEYGLDLSEINIYTPANMLREIKERLKNEDICEQIIEASKELIKDGHDPVELLVLNEAGRFSHVCCELLKLDYDIHNLKMVNRHVFYEIADAIINKGCKVSLKCLEDPDISTRVARCAIALALNGVDIEEYFGKGFSNNRLLQIFEVIDFNPSLDVSPLYDLSFDDAQIVPIATAIMNKVDLLSFCDNRFNAKQMWSIYTGLHEGVDVTLYNKKRYSSDQMDIIYSALSHNNYCKKHRSGMGQIDVEKILHAEYDAALMHLIVMCMKDKIDTSIIENKGYNFAQAFAILEGESLKIDTSLYANKLNSAEEMRTILNSILLKNDGYDVDMSFILDKTVSTKSKIKYLADVICKDFKDINLNKDEHTLEDLINDKSFDLNDYYTGEYKRNGIFSTGYGHEFFRGTTTDGKTVTACFDDINFPEIMSITTNDIDIPESFVKTYQKEISNIASIVTLLDYDEKGYHIKNMALDKKCNYIQDYDIGDNFAMFKRFYGRINEDTIDAIMYDHTRTFTVFDSLEGLAKSFGPDIEKLLLSYEMKEARTTSYVFEKNLCEKYGKHSEKEYNKIFMDETEMQYASIMNDTCEVTLFDECGYKISSESIYGTIDLKEKIEKVFNVEIKECTEISKKRTTKER